MFIGQGQLPQAPSGFLMGAPVIISEHMAALGSRADIMLCDLGQYLLAVAGETKIDSSIHFAYTSDQTIFRGVTRVDGQPALNNSITPAVGTNVLSHFVCLNA